MALASDYFLLCHGIHFEPPSASQVSALADENMRANEAMLQSAALLLAISRKAFEKFMALDAFAPLCGALKFPTPKTLPELHLLQYTLIEALERSQSKAQYQTLQETFTTLLEEEILPKVHYKKLMSLFTFAGEDPLEAEKKRVPFSFPEAKAEIFRCIKSVQSLTENEACCEDVKAFLNAQKFSIGITGVMNAGKSTLINALMGQEVLGTSVVPETANLTLLRYSEKPSATVVYWNLREWQRIEESAKTLEAMNIFVEETQKAFGSKLAAYIQEVSREEEVALSDLPLYTSAERSGKKCNLVKNVILRTNLSFLKEGVEIVDTPGLDDPVIQREEITKSYIGSCDMLLHLMNVSQSATQTDVAFIIDALLYQNVSKLLVVITRADTVTQRELDEVIAYTQRSITTELKRQNKESRLDTVLQNIDFMAISGKMALLCRTEPQKAKALGYTLEKSGLMMLETHLNQTLFGADASKSSVMIAAAKKRLLKKIKVHKAQLLYCLELLSTEREEIEVKWQDLLKEKEERTAQIEMFQNALEESRERLREGLRSLQHFAHSEFHTLESVLCGRVVSDVRYSYEKTKKTPEPDRIAVIVRTAFKDGMIDIVRDYRYKLSQMLEESDVHFRQKYQNSGFPAGEGFDPETFFAETFQHGFLTQNIDIPVQSILDAVNSSKAKEIMKLDRQVQGIVQEMLRPVEEETVEKLERLSLEFIEKLIETLQKPLEEMQLKLSSEEASLKQYRRQGEESEDALSVHEKLKGLRMIENELRGVANV